jgi:hypothetical protein
MTRAIYVFSAACGLHPRHSRHGAQSPTATARVQTADFDPGEPILSHHPEKLVVDHGPEVRAMRFQATFAALTDAKQL